MSPRRDMKVLVESILKHNSDKAIKYVTVRQRLYPEAGLTPTVPLTMALEEYTGIYRDAAYGAFTLESLQRGDDTSKILFEPVTYLMLRTGQYHSLPRTLRFTHIDAKVGLLQIRHRHSSIGPKSMSPHNSVESRVQDKCSRQSGGSTLRILSPI